VNFVNSVIPFSKYNLPEIQPYKTDDDSILKNLHIFKGENILPYHTECKITPEVEVIMTFYKHEVSTNNYKPNDFLIITPFTSNNPLVNALDIAIQMYWVEKYKSDIYEKYSVFHKSEEGTSIDLNESENATRIVSIHTSKGDGRNVVFVIGVTERALLKFSKEPNNLIYDSLLHVSFTRMKKKLYIRVASDDDIAVKLVKYAHDNNVHTDIEPSLTEVRDNFQYKKIIDDHKNSEFFKLLHSDIISKTTYTELFDNDTSRKTIDMGHHNIRFASMIIFIFIKIYNEIRNDEKIKEHQIYQKFKEIKNSVVVTSDAWQDYFTHLKINLEEGYQKNLCILKMSTNGRDYLRYYRILEKFVHDVKEKICRIHKYGLDVLCPLESVVLYYMMETTKNGKYTNIGISELYNIIDVYNGSFQHKCNGHNNCLCTQMFSESPAGTETSETCNQMNKYLLNHYEKISHLGKIYDGFLTEHPKMKWLINHNIIFKGENDDFLLSKRFHLIAYDAENVFLIYIKPQFGNLNYNEVMMESIYDTFLVQNCTSSDFDIKEDTKKSRDFKKFHNKNIQSVVFSLDNDRYHKFEWKNMSTKEDLISNNRNTLIAQIRESLIHKFDSHSKCIFYFYKFYRNKIDILSHLSPQKFMKSFRKHLEEKYPEDKHYKHRLPQFVMKFFYCIEIELKLQKHKSHEVLQQYDDLGYFTSKLHTIITEAVDDFLGMENHSDSD
jgi:hypothetical protein